MAADDVERESLATPPKVGDLGRYRLIAELARGGMGIVYLALVRGPRGFNKLFVVKELKTHLGEDPNLVSMFLEEARLAAKLSHPNVVQTIEIGSDGSRHFIAMEFLDGQSLNRLLSRVRRSGTPLPLHYHLLILVHLLDGLQYAHAVTDFDGAPLKLVHRDVSPQNVFITYDGQVKLLDFGIAKALDSAHDTRTGMLKGKVPYMAPEQAAGESIDRRADLFSIGVMLWEAVVGRRMWSNSQNDLQILHALMRDNIPLPRDAKPDIDPALERMILKATAAKPEDRYATGAEFQAELEEYLKHMGQPSFGARDIGKFLSDVFSEERARVKNVIDDQLRFLSVAPSGHYATIDLPLLNSSSPGTPSGVLRAKRSGSQPTFPTLPSLRLLSDAPSQEEIAPALAPPGGSARVLIAVVAAAGLAVAGGVGLLALRHPPAPQAKVAAVGSSPPPASPTPTPVSGPVHAFVTASPREAQIAIDDGVPRTGTFTATFPRDGRTHAIRVEAPRYQAKVLGFVADDDRTFDVSLEPLKDEATAPQAAWHAHGRHDARPAPQAQAPAPAVAAPAQPAAQPAPSATGRPKQQIDTSDPYAH